MCSSDLKATLRLYSLGSLALVGVPSLVIALLARPILAVYGMEFKQFAGALVVLLVGTVIFATNLAYGQALLAADLTWHRFAYGALWAVVLVAVGYLLIPSMGARGMAWGYAASYVAHFSLQYVTVSRAVKL